MKVRTSLEAGIRRPNQSETLVRDVRKLRVPGGNRAGQGRAMR
jgi:hypothetical protein